MKIVTPPEIGQRIRVHHPHLGPDGATGTVEKVEELDMRGIVGVNARYKIWYRVDPDHWAFQKGYDLTYIDTLAEHWEPDSPQSQKP